MNSRMTHSLPSSRFIARIFFLAMIGVGPGPSRGSEAEMDRVKREYPAACAKLRRFYEQMSGTCVVTMVKKGRPPYSAEMKFAVQGRSRKASTVEHPAPGGPKAAREDVFCAGDQSSFSLSRGPRTDEGGWRLLSAGGDRYEATNYDKGFGRYQEFPYGGGQHSWSELIDGVGHHLTAVDPVTHDGRPCLQIRIEPKVPLQGYSSLIVVDPEMAWAARRVDTFLVPGKIADSTWAEYGPSRSGLPVIQRATHSANGNDHTCEFKAISFEPTPAAEFTLPFYGLPTVDGRVGGPSRWRGAFWLGAIGVVGLASAYGLRRLARRGARMATA